MVWHVVRMAAYMVRGVEVPSWCEWWRCLPGASGGGASLVPVAAWILARIFTAGHPGGHARQLLSAAGNLASESKLQGEIDRCDYSYYQLFRCSFRVCFYGAVCRIKRWLLVIYRGKIIIQIQKNSWYTSLFYKKIQKKTLWTDKTILFWTEINVCNNYFRKCLHNTNIYINFASKTIQI